jgi:hypothetical protein
MEEVKEKRASVNSVDAADTFPAKTTETIVDPELEQALANYVSDSDEEKRLVRKLDMYMMPTLWTVGVPGRYSRTHK